MRRNQNFLAAPKLRFSEFEESLKNYKLGEFAKFRRGSFPQPYGLPEWYDDENGKPFIQVFDVDEDFKLKPNTKNKISALAEKKSVFVKKGTLILTIQGSIGRIAITQYDAYIDRTLLIFKEFVEEVDQYYFAYVIYLLFDHEKKLAPGGTIKTITKKALSSFLFSLPGLAEQKKISSFLSVVDKKINLLKQKQSLLQQYKKGVIQQLLSRQIHFKDDSGKGFPDWKEKTLGELADKVRNKNKDDTIKNVLTNSAKHGIVNQLDYFNKEIANENNLTNYSIVDKDDFVYNPRISEYAPVGPIKRNYIGQGIMSPLYTVFCFKDDAYLDYLEMFFQTTYWHRYMNSIANFGARHDRMNITMSDFFKLPIELPCKEEIKKIIAFIAALDKKVNAVGEQIELTQTFKNGLLQQMFV